MAAAVCSRPSCDSEVWHLERLKQARRLTGSSLDEQILLSWAPHPLHACSHHQGLFRPTCDGERAGLSAPSSMFHNGMHVLRRQASASQLSKRLQCQAMNLHSYPAHAQGSEV